MEIRVVDFDVLTKNYTNYQEGILNLSNTRNSFIDRIEPIKKEMETFQYMDDYRNYCYAGVFYAHVYAL